MPNDQLEMTNPTVQPASKRRPKVWITSDGSAKPNPGAGAWAAILRSARKEKEISGGEPETTNNRMELTALVRALQELRMPCEVTVVTDSQYLMKAFNEHWIDKWKQNGWRTAGKDPVKNQDLWIELDDLLSQHEVTWEWCKGHAGHADNERVDVLAAETRKKLFGV
jgi:ribonuclease HI